MTIVPNVDDTTISATIKYNGSVHQKVLACFCLLSEQVS